MSGEKRAALLAVALALAGCAHRPRCLKAARLWSVYPCNPWSAASRSPTATRTSARAVSPRSGQALRALLKSGDEIWLYRLENREGYVAVRGCQLLGELTTRE